MEQKIIAAGLIAVCPETGRFLLLKRREDIEYPGYWNLPGGSFDEKDKYPKITAIREFREETGYNGIVKISKSPLYIDRSNCLDFYTYVGILPWEFIPYLKGECARGDESLDYGWFPVNCKWEYNEKIMPSIITVLNLKREILEIIVNKFKDKNFE
jgi:8-oxo-dGTP pyrophosphatase MutT (NUDIX family)